MRELNLFFNNLNEAEFKRVSDSIQTMQERDVFMMKNGQVVLHYDHEGTLQEIGFNYKRWKRRKT
jgi:hypothetical protein